MAPWLRLLLTVLVLSLAAPGSMAQAGGEPALWAPTLAEGIAAPEPRAAPPDATGGQTLSAPVQARMATRALAVPRISLTPHAAHAPEARAPPHA